ncbi:MAG: alpha-L-fucosidase [Candidatus Cyclobacteriaceae bacterium M3_2C_046]
MKKLMIFSLVILFLAGCTSNQNQSNEQEDTTMETNDYLQETSAEKAERMNWWKDARFGMFIHWGLYAVPAGEYKGERSERIGEWIMHHLNIPISEYEEFAGQFNPVKFNAEEWVNIAKNAGMKYIIITSKHHDGFALWDSEVTDWDIIDATPYNQDILKELAEACRKEGIKLGFYHSIMDWHHPDAQAIWEPNYNQGRDSDKVNPNFERYVEEFMKPQLKELLTNYGDIAVLWFDGEWIPDYTSEMGKDLYNYIRNLQPDIIINNRVDKGRRGMEGLDAEGDFAGDFGTPEQEIPATGVAGVEWESCMTMNDTWGYKSFDHNWKSDTTLIRNLVDIVSKGGNFLLNVGPTAEGEIPPPSVERLSAMGDWLEVNGEAIYEAQASPVDKPSWGRYTQKEGKVYAHIFDWPQDQTLRLDGISTVEKAYLLADPSNQLEVNEEGTIRLPAQPVDPIATVVVLEVSPGTAI